MSRMIKNFNSLLEGLRKFPPTRLSVAQAADKKTMLAVKNAVELGIVEPILVGQKDEIKKQVKKVALSLNDIEIVDTDKETAANIAVRIVHENKADVLMKGMVSTSVFLKAVLNPDFGLRTGRLLSHIAALEVSTLDRIIFVTDGGMNINPSINQKAKILENGIDALKLLGYEDIRVAILAAVETVSEKMPATIDAAILSKMVERNQISKAIVEGPLALDSIIDEKAAHRKGIVSPVVGKADLILVPNIETGNVLCKSVTFLSKGNMAGIVVGARVPIVLSSRADSSFSKLVSIALACSIFKGGGIYDAKR